MKGYPLLASTIAICLLSFLITIYCYANDSVILQKLDNSILWLEIVVNGKPSGKVVPVEYHDHSFWLTQNDLEKVGLSMLIKDNHTLIAINKINGIEVTYSSELQQLLIDIPTSWLPLQRIVVNKTNYQYSLAKSSFGALINYDLYITSPEQSNAANTATLWTEQRFFGNHGIIYNTGIYRQSFNGSTSSNQYNRYLRYETQWKYSNKETMTSYVLGDHITNVLAGSNAVRLGGFQISRNFATRPDLITYPLPDFTGSAAIPSTVDLYINNYKMDSQHINPGPFTLETQPFINGAGSATVIITNPLGQQVSTTIPFYVASQLLDKGLIDYSTSFGVLRRDYGLKSNEYSHAAFSSSMRYGLLNWMTIEGRVEGAKYLASSGIGANLKIFNYGVLNLSVAASKANNKAWNKDIKNSNYYYDSSAGLFEYQTNAYRDSPKKNNAHQAVLGYTYTNRIFSINAQRIIRAKDYADLSSYRSGYRPNRRQDQLTVSLGMNKLGTLGIGYFALKNTKAKSTKLINASWSTNIWHNINIYTSLNKEIGRQGVSAQLLFTIPFDTLGMVSINSSRDNNNHWTTRTNWSRSVPTDGGIGWNIATTQANNPNDQYRQANLAWRTDFFETNAGMYGTKNNYIRWGEMTGSLVIMDGGIYPTNTVSDAFALVSTNGFNNIPVFYENQLIGKTNNKGYLLIPSMTSWYPTKLTIDPLNLPVDVNISSTNKNLSIPEKSGLLVDFHIERIRSVTLTLVDNSNKAIPKGSIIKTNQQQTTWVGINGMVWLQNVKANTLKITVIRADNQALCRLTIQIPPKQNIMNIGKHQCQ